MKSCGLVLDFGGTGKVDSRAAEVDSRAAEVASNILMLRITSYNC